MSSPLADRVVQAAREYGLAFLKFAQPNDLGITGGHQKGFHINLRVAQYFTPQDPVDGINHDHPIRIRWDNGDVTDSVVKWYGSGTRHEYRLTSFNRIRDFYYLRPERLGSVLVVAQAGEDVWRGFMLETDDDIETVTAALGVSLADSNWALYRGSESAQRDVQSSTECEATRLKAFCANRFDFPSSRTMSSAAREVVEGCGGRPASADKALIEHVRVEFDLFKALEQSLTLDRVSAGFDSVDSFVELANSVLQRRKARAGKALENHFEDVLSSAGISFDAQPTLDQTRPDFVVPAAAAYEALDGSSVADEVFVIAVKTTCKDRWRQILNEAPKVNRRYLVTLQHGVSSAQMQEMRDAAVQLVVPKELHANFAPEDRGSLLTLDDFLAMLPAGSSDGRSSAASLF